MFLQPSFLAQNRGRWGCPSIPTSFASHRRAAPRGSHYSLCHWTSSLHFALLIPEGKPALLNSGIFLHVMYGLCTRQKVTSNLSLSLSLSFLQKTNYIRVFSFCFSSAAMSDTHELKQNFMLSPWNKTGLTERLACNNCPSQKVCSFWMESSTAFHSGIT